MKIKYSFLLIAVVYLFSGCSKTVWIQKDFAATAPVLDTVSIIFPQIEYAERNGEKMKTKSGHSYYVSKQVAEVLKEQIDSGIFIVRNANIVFDSILTIKWMRNNFADSKRLHKQMLDSLKSTMGETRTIPLIPELQQAVDLIHTRYYLLVTGYSFGTNETTKRFDLIQQQTFEQLYDHAFAQENDWFGLTLQITLIDSRTNEILWYSYNKEQESRYDPLDRERVKDLCLGLLTTK